MRTSALYSRFIARNFQSKMFWIYLSLALFVELSAAAVGADRQCHPLNYMNACYHMGFSTHTKFPNAFNFTDLESATNNFNHMAMMPSNNNTCGTIEGISLSILVCLLHFPLCNDGIQMLPCKGFCNETFSRCGFSEMNGIPTTELCNTLPEHGCFPEGYNRKKTEGECEPVKIPLCEIYGFTETAFPNSIGHATQDEAIVSLTHIAEEASRADRERSQAMQNGTGPYYGPHNGTEQYNGTEYGPYNGTGEYYGPYNGTEQYYGPYNETHGPYNGSGPSQESSMKMSVSFVCSLFFPKCRNGQITPPCRSYCQKMSVQMNITSIPGKVDDLLAHCNQYPDDEKSCVGPQTLDHKDGICPIINTVEYCHMECFTDNHCPVNMKCCSNEATGCRFCSKPFISDGGVNQDTMWMIVEDSGRFVQEVPLESKPFALLLDKANLIERFLSSLPKQLRSLGAFLFENKKIQARRFDTYELMPMLKALSRISQEHFQIFVNLNSNSKGISLPPEMIELLVLFKPHVIHNISAAFTADQLEHFCPLLLKNQRLNRRYMEYVLANIPRCNAHIMQHTQKGGEHLTREQAEVVLDNIRAVTAPEKWSLDVLKTAPDAVKVEDIRKMNISQFTDVSSLNNVMKQMPKRVKKEAMKKIKKARGQASARNWDKKMFETMATMFPEELKTKELREIPDNVIIETLHDLPEETILKDSRLATNIQKKIVSHLRTTKTDIRTLPPSNVTDMLPFLVKNVQVFEELTPRQVSENLDKLNSMSFKKSEKRRILKKLGTNINYTAAGNLVEALRPKEISQISADNLVKMMPNLKKMNLTKGQVKAVRKTMGENFPKVTEINTNNIEEYGSLLSAFNGDELDQLPENLVTEKLSVLSSVDMDKSKFRRIVKKLKESQSTNIASNFKKLGEHAATSVPRQWLEEGSYSDLGLEDGLDVETSPAQSSTIFDIVKKELGFPGPENLNYTGSRMEGFGTMGVYGPNLTDLENLIIGNDGLAIASALFEREDIMLDVKAKLVVQKVREILNLNGDSEIAGLGEEAWYQLHHILQYFDWKNDFSKINKSDIMYVCESLKDVGELELNKLTAKEAQAVTDAALRCLEEMSLLSDRKTATALNETHIESLYGSLKCGFTKREIELLDTDALIMSLPDLEECVFFDEQTIRAIIESVKSKIMNVFNDSVYLETMGSLLIHFTDEELQAIDKAEFANAIIPVIEKIRERHDKQEVRKHMGVGRKSSDDSQQMQRFSEFAVDVIINYASTSKRKKRHSHSLTCDEIEAFGPVLSSLSEETISHVQNAEFLACLETFGETGSWTSPQLLILATKAKQSDVLGAVSGWTGDEIRMVGSVTAGLSPAEIGQLQLTTEDLLSSMGKHDLFTADQLSAGFDRWLSLAKSNNVANVISEELLALENFVCGISSTKINSLDSSHVINSLSAFRYRSTCSTDQMVALANKIKAVYGSDVTTWKPSIITDIGMIIGGLDKSSISLLNIDQIGELVPDVIEKIPPSVFSGFSAGQLALFSSNQLRAVTSDQYTALDDVQRGALQKTLGSEVPAISGNGGGQDSSGSTIVVTKILLNMLIFVFFELVL